MTRQADLTPIPGLTADRLLGIARTWNANCKGPNAQVLGDEEYVGWSCTGSLSRDDLASLLTFDFIGLDACRIVSISGQVHRTPTTKDFTSACRRAIGYVLAGLDETLAADARAWFDAHLQNQETGRFEKSGVVFDIILHTDRSLSFDIHSRGF